MINSITLDAKERGISRKDFFAAVGMTGAAVVSANQISDAAQETVPAVAGVARSVGEYLSVSFTGNLNQSGTLVIPHGMGEALPATILSVHAFIRLPGGKVRNIVVDYVDEHAIAIAGGVPDAEVRVGVVYSKS